MSIDILIEKIVEKQNPTVVGLDTTMDIVPNFIKERYLDKHKKTLEAASEAILEFNKQIIDNIYDIVPAIKPQCAYYEMYGYQGMKTLSETIKYAKSKGLYVIVDGKRNDIGPTMEAYSKAYLGKVEIYGDLIEPFQGDSLTINAYLGSDTINPALSMCKKYDKSIFVLTKTSNPSSFEIQDIKINEDAIYEKVGKFCVVWSEDSMGKYGYSNLGAVVGATYPHQIKTLRKKMKNIFFLIPGYGAQGAKACDIKDGFDANGLGAIVNSSRNIIKAYINKNYDEKDFAKAARLEVIEMKNDISSFISDIKLP